MTPPNIAAIAASLQTSLQNFSLDHHHTTTTAAAGGSGLATSSSSSSSVSHHPSESSSDATLELNSNISLPCHWEQCLDLKTGEVYYINWRTGMKAKEDPRTADHGFSSYFYSDEEDEDEEDEDESSYDGEGSSSESSSAVSSSKKEHQKEEADGGGGGGGHVLVVAGCKSCLMYFMVEKQVDECPKCNGQLLHFDRSDENV